MTNKHNQVICDRTKIILEDGVCVYPGYVEIKDGHIFTHTTDDPNNKITPGMRGFKAGMLKNRKEYERIEQSGKNDRNIPEGHYISLDVAMELAEPIDN